MELTFLHVAKSEGQEQETTYEESQEGQLKGSVRRASDLQGNFHGTEGQRCQDDANRPGFGRHTKTSLKIKQYNHSMYHSVYIINLLL